MDSVTRRDHTCTLLFIDLYGVIYQPNKALTVSSEPSDIYIYVCVYTTGHLAVPISHRETPNSYSNTAYTGSIYMYLYHKQFVSQAFLVSLPTSQTIVKSIENQL